MVKEHKRHEVGAKGGNTQSENAASGRDPAATQDGDPSSPRADETMQGERPFETPDRELPTPNSDSH